MHAGISHSAKRTCFVALLLALASSVVFVSPSLAGCICNALASYVDCGGTIMSIAFIICAFLFFRQGNLNGAKKLVAASVILATLTIGISTSLNSSLWSTPGVVANSESWLEGGVPAHWVSLLVIGIVFGLLFIGCSMLPTVIAYRRHLENRRLICNMNMAILLIPGIFVMAPFMFFDLGSYSLMMFWSILFTNPKLIAEIPVTLLGSITAWSVLLGVFAITWGKLLQDASQPKEVTADENSV